jgi:hypothetical protein
MALPVGKMLFQRVFESGIKTFPKRFLLFRFLNGKSNFQSLI